MVSRVLHQARPVDLLDASLRPAAAVAELSPADRVFGWVSTEETGAHRAQLSLCRLTCPTTEAVQKLPALPLPPLSAPKPSQGRFYLADPDHQRGIRPLGAGVRRSELFTGGQVVRGRKVYPHQRWMENAPFDDIVERSRHVPPQGRQLRDTQNATIHGWVKPGAEFTFTVEFRDLHPMELGALLWLLDPRRIGEGTARGRLRLGWGKPLGFGAVELTILTSTVHTGKQIARGLRTLGAEQPTTEIAALADQFERRMSSAPLKALLAAFRHAAVGYPAEQPVHYPKNAPHDAGYEWFVANEKRAAKGDAQSLPPLGGPMLREHT
jgi:CRISPR-associated protein (TIGR03986 family)